MGVGLGMIGRRGSLPVIGGGPTTVGDVRSVVTGFWLWLVLLLPVPVLGLTMLLFLEALLLVGLVMLFGLLEAILEVDDPARLLQCKLLSSSGGGTSGLVW